MIFLHFLYNIDYYKLGYRRWLVKGSDHVISNTTRAVWIILSSVRAATTPPEEKRS